VLGHHRGHHHFTVGQRRGIGVGAPEALYVLATDAQTNRVTVGRREELATERVRVRAATLHRPGGRIDRVKLRYRSKPIACRLEGELNGAGSYDELTVALAEPAYGVAPGQTACFMDGDLVVGQGTIAA
jgi:tRNA-specific 2-thiouridylase